jgi:hypothetical protein
VPREDKKGSVPRDDKKEGVPREDKKGVCLGMIKRKARHERGGDVLVRKGG